MGSKDEDGESGEAGDNSTMKIIDLFSGAGGFSLGFREAGYEILFGIDNDPVAVETYQMNVGNSKLLDIADFDGRAWHGKVDVVIGSPPCQPFSVLNRDTRTLDLSLCDEFMRVVAEIEPNVWVMENVPSTLPLISAPFKKILNAKDYGCLQDRKRAFFSNIDIRPKPLEHKWLSPVQWKKQMDFRPEAVHRLYQTITCRYNSFVKTLPHIKEDKRIRVLHHQEALAIQSFPFNFKLPHATQRQKEILVGNAVPPVLAFAIAESLRHGYAKQQTILEEL